MSEKVMTVRMGQDLADELETVAQVEDVPISEEIRTAIARHIELKRADADFQKRLKESVKRNQRILERLAKA